MTISEVTGQASGTREIRSYSDLAVELASDPHASQWLTERESRIAERVDMADHDLLMMLKLWFSGNQHFDDELRDRIRDSILGYRYWFDEPGSDDAVRWSESHQLAFSVAEYLAGQEFPDSYFINDGRLGKTKKARARERLSRWLSLKFEFGFSEWLSSTYYAVSASALSLLSDYADDDELSVRAAGIADLLLLDMALHRFDGRIVASAGRATTGQITGSGTSSSSSVMASAFDGVSTFDPTEIGSIFVDRLKYTVPPVLVDIAHADGVRRIRSSHGLNPSEVPSYLDELGLKGRQRNAVATEILWGQEAHTTREGISTTLKAIRNWRLHEHPLLSPLAPHAAARSDRLAVQAVRVMNPVTTGSTLYRADVQTFRTPEFSLSSAQRYRPGGFGDQQHIWQAAIRGGVTVFGNHPTSSIYARRFREDRPTAWVGNGINPDVGQHDNMLVVLHDARVRRGYLEGIRHYLSHVYFPFPEFDRTAVRGNVIVGRRGHAFVGIMALERPEMATEVEIVQHADVTGWGVIVSDRSEFSNLEELLDFMMSSRMTYRRDTLQWKTPTKDLQLTWQGNFHVNGVAQEDRYPRYQADWLSVDRRPSTISAAANGKKWALDWSKGDRLVS